MADLDADRVAGFTVALARRLGVPDDPEHPDAARGRVERLAAGPLERFHRDGCRSPFGDDGLPLEWSVKDSAGSFGVRCTVDAADYRRPLDAPAADTLAASVRFALGGAPATHPDLGLDAAALVPALLAGAPPSLAAPLMIGEGLGGQGLARTSVYVRTGFWTPGLLERRLPVVAAAVRSLGVRLLESEPEVVGVDQADERAVRWKTYHWLPATRAGLAAGVSSHPDLAVAEALCGRYPPARETARAGFLQATGDGDRLQLKAFLFTTAWGWADPAGLADLLNQLPRFGLHTGALGAVREVAGAHGVRLRLSMLAVGGGPDPSITYYLVPGRRPAAD